MYDIDQPEFIFIKLLEDFIHETERSLAYFFAFIVFLFTFLLALFGKEVLFTGLVGVLCLLLIKLHDIIESFHEIRSNCLFTTVKEKSPAYDETALTSIAKEFPQKFKEKDPFSSAASSEFLSHLRTCRKIIETTALFFPDCPFHPETRQIVKKMTEAAQKYLLRYLKNKYDFTKEQMLSIETNLSGGNITDLFLLQTQLEAFGVDEKTALWTVRVTEILEKINSYIDPDGTYATHLSNNLPVDRRSS